MVAISAFEVISRVVGVLRINYDRCFGKSLPGTGTIHQNLKPPDPSVPLPHNRPVLKGRKLGRVKRKRFEDFARGDSVVLMPGAFPKGPSENKKKSRRRKAHEPEDDHARHDRTADEGQARPSAQANIKPVNGEDELIMRELNNLMFDKELRERWFEATALSERAKALAAERKARLEKEKLRNTRESERREEKGRSDSWKNMRLAQLERKKKTAKSKSAREKAERKHSRLQRAFQEQEQRRENEERWIRPVETNAKVAAKRGAGLVQGNARLQGNLQATGDALRRACDEREGVEKGMEEGRDRRVHTEESRHRWEELMRENFPGGQPQQPQPEQLSSLQTQFDAYDQKWEILQSGVDFDGSAVNLVFFFQIPWPVINMILTHPKQILPEHIQEFVMHPLRVKPDEQGKSKRLRVKEELIKWHSDKFNSIVLSKVHKGDKAAAAEVAGMIARVLTDMLA